MPLGRGSALVQTLVLAKGSATALSDAVSLLAAVADMQSFVESYPEFRKLSGDVTKHVTLLGEINRLVDLHCLMECSQVVGGR